MPKKSKAENLSGPFGLMTDVNTAAAAVTALAAQLSAAIAKLPSGPIVIGVSTPLGNFQATIAGAPTAAPASKTRKR
jgi:hypothetical protein